MNVNAYEINCKIFDALGENPNFETKNYEDGVQLIVLDEGSTVTKTKEGTIYYSLYKFDPNEVNTGDIHGEIRYKKDGTSNYRMGIEPGNLNMTKIIAMNNDIPSNIIDIINEAKDLSTNPKVKGYYGKLVEILEPIISQLIGREITVDEIAQLAKSTPQTAKTGAESAVTEPAKREQETKDIYK